MIKSRMLYNKHDEKEQSDKPGMFRQMREKISTTFGSSRKEGDSLNGERNVKAGNEPTSLNAICLHLARAMSGISNLDFFQFIKEE